MIITLNMEVCHSQHLSTKFQGQCHNFDSKQAVIMGFVLDNISYNGRQNSHDYWQ